MMTYRRSTGILSWMSHDFCGQLHVHTIITWILFHYINRVYWIQTRYKYLMLNASIPLEMIMFDQVSPGGIHMCVRYLNSSLNVYNIHTYYIYIYYLFHLNAFYIDMAFVCFGWFVGWLVDWIIFWWMDGFGCLLGWLLGWLLGCLADALRTHLIHIVYFMTWHDQSVNYDAPTCQL